MTSMTTGLIAIASLSSSLHPTALKKISFIAPSLVLFYPTVSTHLMFFALPFRALSRPTPNSEPGERSCKLGRKTFRVGRRCIPSHALCHALHPSALSKSSPFFLIGNLINIKRPLLFLICFVFLTDSVGPGQIQTDTTSFYTSGLRSPQALE
ncbi:hypothetical protein BC827DRAFT_173779 [Russula dissimulans]|nr:hypothetical protein BC827DRAFT_173779 [Russula dissimulans]